MLLQVFPLAKATPYVLCGVWGDPRGNGTRSHQGVDLCCAFGAPVLATNDGTVSFGQDPLGGHVAVIQIGGGVHVYLAHLSAFEGGARTVRAGDVVGYVGCSGDASCSVVHVHVGVYSNGAAIDPLPYLKAAPHVSPNLSTTAAAVIAGSICASAGAFVWALQTGRLAKWL
jgi:murein DD-endopeptidase MepM/ murein hydrolase activator NlpD